MDQKEIDYLRAEYEYMTIESLEEMLSYGQKQYEPEVWKLLNEIIDGKRSKIEESEPQELEADVETHGVEGYIALVQVINAQEADSCADLLDENEIDYYFEPYQAGIARASDPHSFIVVSHKDYTKAAELVLGKLNDAQLRN